MTDAEPLGLESQFEPTANGELRGMQFSLAGLFVVTTVTAVILSAFFGVARLLGMSAWDVLAQGLGRFLFVLPTMLVWIVGLVMATRRLRRNRRAAILTIIALGSLFLGSLVLNVGQMALIQSVNSNRISPSVLSWSFAAMSIAYAVLHTTCWILILAAIFARRPPEAPAADKQGDTGSPFLTSEA